MTELRQILLGTAVLALCAGLHLWILALGFATTIGVTELSEGLPQILRWWIKVSLAFAIVVFGHTLQVWIWAIALWRLGALRLLEDAIYFSLVTTTTLGYGDVTLGRHHRVLGAMGAVCGLLTFGVSTAFLISMMSRLE